MIKGALSLRPLPRRDARAALPRIARRIAAPRRRAAAGPLRGAARGPMRHPARRISLGLAPLVPMGQLGLTHRRALPPRNAGKTPEEIRKTFNIQNDFTPVRRCGAPQRVRDVALM